MDTISIVNVRKDMPVINVKAVLLVIMVSPKLKEKFVNYATAQETSTRKNLALVILYLGNVYAA